MWANSVSWEIFGPTTDEDNNLGCCVMRNLCSLCRLYDVRLMNSGDYRGLGWAW